MVNVREAATLRRVRLGLLLTWPILVVCGNPSFDLRYPTERIEVDDSGSGDAEGEGETAQNTAAETLPADVSGGEQTILNMDLRPISTLYGQLVISRNGFTPGQATSGLNVFVSNSFFPFLFHGASDAFIEVTGNPTGGALDFVTRVDSTTFGIEGLPTSAHFGADDHATATCFDTSTPNQLVRFRLPVGDASRFTLPLATPGAVTATARCEFELETNGAARSIPGALHTLVLTLAQITSSTPEDLDDLPPTVSPIGPAMVRPG
jgi:hypothetical protein